MSKHYRKDKDCLNCGHDVNGKFCSNCGQENIETKEHFWSFVSHGIAHYFHYDSKFRSTLRPFLTKPGQLTVDYIEGRRSNHIPPISLYLFITLIYFLCAPVLNKNKASYYNYGRSIELNANSDKEDTRKYDIQFKMLTIDQQKLEISSLDSVVKQQRKSGDRSYSLENKLRRLKRFHTARLDSTIESYRARQANLQASQKDDLLEQKWQEQKIAYRSKTGTEFNSQELIDKYFPKLLFILMPLFAFFLMLNFRRNKKLYMDHLIFTVHLFSFAYLNYFVFDLLNYILPMGFKPFLDILQSIIFVWYIYRAIRVVYQRSRWATVRKLVSITMLFAAAFMITYSLTITVAMLFA